MRVSTCETPKGLV